MRAESRGVYDTRASFTTGVGGVGQRVNRWSQRPSAATISRQKKFTYAWSVCVCGSRVAQTTFSDTSQTGMTQSRLGAPVGVGRLHQFPVVVSGAHRFRCVRASGPPGAVRNLIDGEWFIQCGRCSFWPTCLGECVGAF